MVFSSIQRFGANSRATAHGLGVHESGYEQKFPKNTSFNTVRATTSANTDRTHRCIPDGGIAGLENISLVTNFVVEPSSSRMEVRVFSDSAVVC